MLGSGAPRYGKVVISNLQSGLRKLQWFERVNHEAVDRIFDKLRKSRSHYDFDPDSVYSEWCRMQEVVERTRVRVRESLRDAIDSIRASEEPDTPLWAKMRHVSPSHDFDFTLAEDIARDLPDALKTYFDRNQDLQPEFYRTLFKILVLRHSWKCLTVLVSRFPFSFDHYCLSVLFSNLPAPSTSGSLVDSFESASRVICELFANDRETTTRILCQANDMGYSPLHYAMKSGFDISKEIRRSLDEEKCHALLLGPMLAKDKQGLTPLHFATIEGHTLVVVSFFDILPINLKRNKSQEVNVVAAACLNIAIKLGNDALVEYLSEWANTKSISAQRRSAFHLAARVGRCDYMTALINACASEDLSLNITDSCGHTPLMDASARGHGSMVELLLKAGADPSLKDYSAWTARKYAVHRGHLGVAVLLPKPDDPLERHSTDPEATLSANVSTIASQLVDDGLPKHMLVIYLGSMQLTNDRSTVQLVGTSNDMHHNQSVPELHRLELSVNQSNKQFLTIDLPILEDQSSEPFIFTLDAEAEPQILVTLFKGDLIDEPRSVQAAGAALLHSTRSLCGHQHESLVREHTIILLSPDSQEVIGSVLLTCLIARPFDHLQTQIPMPSLTSNESGQIMLVGHRGFGQNGADRSQLQLGENTIGSFMAAADHGATFVEFDAQVTRDLQTVIYHDFSLSETGTDIPIHDLTIDQYKYASSVQTPHGSPLITSDERTVIGKGIVVRRSRSFDGQKDLGAALIRDRLKHTVDFKSKAMKPNIRGDVIQEPLVTLPELFQNLPPSLGFNIEIKYPRLHEANDAGIAPIGLEINLFVDTVLEQIHQFADQRPIILSSFTPEICILLSIKQKAYPVLFISNGGKLPTNDFERRVASVQAGVHFAKTWGLAGLCLASEPLMLCPELINDIKRSGLLCASYGPQNSLPENVLIQRDAGLDMIMVDRVALIAKTLKQ
ncbi:Glycerophosphoryl diester phosphodiesterase family-domain-containing protein [Nemania abortiva]|nr:Glycerophosphoryl diester phosphodiesterase family-domain-containing protein [Nemania abortiva]